MWTRHEAAATWIGHQDQKDVTSLRALLDAGSTSHERGNVMRIFRAVSICAPTQGMRSVLSKTGFIDRHTIK